MSKAWKADVEFLILDLNGAFTSDWNTEKLIEADPPLPEAAAWFAVPTLNAK